jgi:uncharacterized iron-regulated protein
LAVAAFVTIAFAGPALAQDVRQLTVGDPERRDRQVAVEIDRLTDTRSGETLTPAELAGRLDGVRLLLVGESHTNMEAHRVQLAVVRGLVEAGREVLIGLEMYPYTEQDRLDQWTDGLLTEKGFVLLSGWYRNWGYNWGYYRSIFEYARHNGVSMVAVNTPRSVVTAVREKGFDGLSELEAAHIPPRIDTDNDDHLRLFRAYMGPPGSGHEVGEEALVSMFEAQCTWDATMAYNAVRSLEDHPEAIMVVLVGSGHVAYGLGIQRQAEIWFDGQVASLIPVPVGGDEDNGGTRAQASYANFIWGVAPEAHTLYPGIGFSTRQPDPEDPIEIIILPPDSAASEAGVKVGDTLVSIDGIAIPDEAAMKRLVADKRWGDGIVLGLERAGESVEAAFLFRRR